MSAGLHRPILAALFAGLLWSGVAYAQPATGRPDVADNFLQQQRVIDERLEALRRELEPVQNAVDWRWGGWIDYYAFHFDDGVQESREYHRPGLSLWTRLSLDEGAHEIFARMRLRYDYFNPGDQFDRQEDWWGPNLDRGWYQIDVGRAFRLTEPGDPVQLRARLGRQEVRFGTGYALDLPLDAVLLEGRLGDVIVTGLFGRTPSSYPNIDRSEPVDTHSARDFYGVQAAYDGFERHQPFVYYIWNNDFIDERPKDAFQNYAYDTEYLGVGSRGELARNFNYSTEVVFEQGHSFGDGMFLRQDEVHAWAANLYLNYLFDGPHRAQLGFEYMFASGDADRRFSPTNAPGGNFGHNQDTSFVAFGYRNTGISAAPTLSNIHIWRLGGSLRPFPEEDIFRDLEVGTNWFLYHKHQREAAISDPTATVTSGYVGWEMDYFVNWRLASDVAWTVRWGAFFPGDAYRERDTRHFIFTGVTWSF